MNYAGMEQVRELRKKRLQRRQEVPSRPAATSQVAQPAVLHPSSQMLLTAARFGVKVTEEEKSTPAVATARVLQQLNQQEELQQLREKVKKIEQQKWFYATPLDTTQLYTARDSVSAEAVLPDERVLLLYPLEQDELGNVWVTVRRLFDNGTIEDFIAKFYSDGQPRFGNFTFSNASCI